MPQMGVSVAEGTILEWRKRPGDWVEADETICEVTTDKIDVEIPSPATGASGAILARRGRARRSRSGRRSPRSTPRPSRRAPVERRSSSGPRPRRRPPPPTRRRSLAVLLAGGAPDRRQARDRSEPGRGHRSRRPRPQEGRARPGEASPRLQAGRAEPAPHRVAVPAEPALETRRNRPPSAASPCPPMRQRDREHMVREPPDGGPLHDGRRGRHVAGSRAARRAPSRSYERVASPHRTSPSSRRATVAALARGPAPERVGRRRRDRPPRRRQPRDRGRPRRRPDRARDPPGAAARACEGLAAAIGDLAERARSKRLASQTTSTAARSRSPTPATSGPCSRRRSSTSRRSRSSTSRRS